jgi:hypothetical protein
VREVLAAEVAEGGPDRDLCTVVRRYEKAAKVKIAG